MAHEDSYQFWVVWCPSGGAPSHIHEAGALAQAEAERLAAMNPGKRFYVLKGLRFAQTVKPSTVVELQPPPTSIPF